MSVDYFQFAAEQARRMAKVLDTRTDRHVCPGCGGDLSGDVSRDGREDETCGSPHCREQWYGEIAERH
jgi:ribosomal protein L37AE/L43A